jgi:hypothetical protein
VLEEATMLRSAQEFQWTEQLGRVSDMSKALLDAWLACVDTAREAFPHAVERAAPTCPANWIELTGGGDLAQLDQVPDQMQRPPAPFESQPGG